MERGSFARNLRKNKSEAEALFWQKVKGRRFCNLKFKRQVPIDKYIADFVCEHKELIVELDGFQHDENVAYDDKRTDILQRHGYRLWRIRNEDIYEDIDEVLNDMKQFLGQQLFPLTRPVGHPLPLGRGQMNESQVLQLTPSPNSHSRLYPRYEP